MQEKELKISGLETVHESMKFQYERRIRDLESKAKKLTEKNKQLEYRRALDSEGFTNDISLLRKQLLVLDRKLHQMRLLDQLENDERLATILKSLDKRIPLSNKNCQKRQKNSAKTASEAASELGEIKGAITKIENRLAARRQEGNSRE